MYYNENFTRTLPFQSSSLLEETEDCSQLKIQNLLWDELSKELSDIENMTSGEMLSRCTIREIEYLPSVYFLNDGEQFVIMLRNCCDKDLIKEELVERFEAVIYENHSMVQQISHILGETSVKRIKMLNSFIKALR